jgi:FKBP-type peptidyl-prolyl cis-trans isomerase SlyD
MQVTRNKVVTISYELSESGRDKLEAGTLDYLHGFRNLIPALENFLTGKKEGFSGQVEVLPRDAFGEVNPDMVMTIPKEQLEKPDDIQVGMQIELESEDRVIPALVTAVSADSITVDANHPYAGKTLTFAIKVLSIRDATAEELAHGHAHGVHGHQH